MRLWPFPGRQRRAELLKHAIGMHPGIRLRISNISGELVDADSDHLYYSAKFGNPVPCGPDCLQSCDKHGWLELIPGAGEMTYLYDADMPLPGRLKIEVKPVILTGWLPDD